MAACEPEDVRNYRLLFGEMLAMRIPEITHPDDRGRDWEAFQSVVSGKLKNCQLEKRYIRKDGKTVWVNVNMTVINDLTGQPIRTIATIEDITERKLVEEAKKESEERLEVLAKATFEGIAFIDGGVVIDANPQLAKMHQYELSELIGKPLADLVAPEGWELARQNVDAGYEGRYENLLLRKDGSTIVVETQAKHFEYRGRTVRVSVCAISPSASGPKRPLPGKPNWRSNWPR